MPEPLASIVIPVWNRAATLERAIKSVLAQTEPDLELIVVDNGSVDPEAVPAIVSACSDRRVRSIRNEQNLGPGGGRNSGVSVASGRTVGFLDSDDELDSRWLELMAAPLSDPECSAVTCGLALVDANGQQSGVVLPSPLGASFAGVTGLFQAGTMLFQRAMFERLGGYDARLWYSENTDIGMRIANDTLQHSRYVVSLSDVLMRWHRVRTARGYERRRLEAAELMLTKHETAFALDRRARDDYLAVAGVDAARLGEFRRARGHMWTLVRAAPRPRNMTRLALAWCPPLARRQWGSTTDG